MESDIIFCGPIVLFSHHLLYHISSPISVDSPSFSLITGTFASVLLILLAQTNIYLWWVEWLQSDLTRQRYPLRLLQGWANRTVRIQNIFTEYTGNWKGGSTSDKVESIVCRQWRVLLVDYDEVIKMEWCHRNVQDWLVE